MYRIGILPSGGKSWIAGSIYLKNIILSLCSLPVEERPEVFLVRHIHSSWDHLPELKNSKINFCHYSHRKDGNIKEGLRLMQQSLFLGKWPQSYESLFARLQLHALFPVSDVPGNKIPAPWIGWIPDFQHKHLPQFFSKEELQKRDVTFQRLIDEAPHLVVSSQEALKDLTRWYQIKKERVSVLSFPMAPIAPWYEPDPGLTVRKFKLPGKFMMFPSQFWVHKNHPVLFDAMRILKQKGMEDIALVCTGFQEDYRAPDHFKRLRSFIDEHKLKQHIYILGLLERFEQIQLLRAAAVVIQPSLFEGWSSLVEDCRTLGKRIYISDIPVHREQRPAHAQFFDPHNSEDLADRIARDWVNLNSGPDKKQEQISQQESAQRAVTFGRTFLEIVKKTQSAEYSSKKG